MFQETRFQVQVLKPCKSIQESSERVQDFKTRQLASIEVQKLLKPAAQQLAQLMAIYRDL